MTYGALKFVTQFEKQWLPLTIGNEKHVAFVGEWLKKVIPVCTPDRQAIIGAKILQRFYPLLFPVFAVRLRTRLSFLDSEFFKNAMA